MWPTDIGMARGRGGLEGRWQRATVQPIFQDGFQTLIGAGADRERPLAGGFKACVPVAFPQAHNPSARAEALLRMGTRSKNGFHHPGDGWATTGGPADQTLRRPLGIVPMRRGHMRSDGTVAPFVRGLCMTGHALPL